MTERKLFFLTLGLLLLFSGGLYVLYRPAGESERIAADRSECRANLKAVSAALEQYAERFGVYPEARDTEGLLPLFRLDLEPDLEHFVCPGTTTQTRGELRDDTLSYYYFPPSGKKRPAADEVVLADHPGNHPGGFFWISFGDGSVRGYRLGRNVSRSGIPAAVRRGRSLPLPEE